MYFYIYIFNIVYNHLLDLLLLLSKFNTVIAVLIGSYFAVREFKYKAIHNKRIEILSEAYEKIKRTHISFSNLTKPLVYTNELSEEERNKKFVIDANDMVKFLEEKRLFFSTKELSYIDKIIKLFHDNYSDYRLKEVYKTDNNLRTESYEIWNKIWNSVQTDMKILLNTFELELKKVLNIK